MTAQPKVLLHLTLWIVAGVVAFPPASAFAQSQLDATEAQSFLGVWDLALETEMGPLTLSLQIENEGGKVAASLTAPEVGGIQEIEDIRKSGEDLVMRYDMNSQGEIVRVSVTLTPNGERLNAAMDFAQGMFVANGIATRGDG